MRRLPSRSSVVIAVLLVGLLTLSACDWFEREVLGVGIFPVDAGTLFVDAGHD